MSIKGFPATTLQAIRHLAGARPRRAAPALGALALSLGLGLGLSLPPAPAHAATEILDQVVAIVDDDVIMASELRERLTSVTEGLQARGMEMPPEDELIRETLDRLILESIQLQMGQRVGVRISDAQLDQAVARIAAQNRMNVDQFIARLEQEGQSYAAMRENVRREMILQRVQAGNVSQRIQITDQEIDNFLGTEEGQALTQPEYRIVHALLAISPDAPADEKAAAEAYVQKLLKRIRAGEPFDQVIASSTGKYTFTGGDLGWRRAGELPSLFADIAPTLAQGETADPIESASGIHLINMNAKRGGEQIVAQTKVRHILIKPSEILTDDQARQKAADLKARIEGGEDFGELAKEYSEDIGSAQEGGDLGWTQSGQMVPEFENAMDSAKIDKITDPVRSQFGWHILEVTDRRDQDMTDQAIRNKAAEYLHSRKYQEELDAWLRKIRDEAFVDIK
ncbi:peptidylprolyl isomerase [Parahaliea mediterranea]|uniref:peptidylprolyl isomerase n=1 Tax=Parahaliea mediterranea TaxID=651086 RepID=UPI001F4DCE71|nr:peptidylprolyl isomerase [Parahaliea mediterranea]